jgi:hypothetical protein
MGSCRDVSAQHGQAQHTTIAPLLSLHAYICSIGCRSIPSAVQVITKPPGLKHFARLFDCPSQSQLPKKEVVQLPDQSAYLVHMCCSTPRLSCHAFSLAYDCSSVLKETRVGLQQRRKQQHTAGAEQCSQNSSVPENMSDMKSTSAHMRRGMCTHWQTPRSGSSAVQRSVKAIPVGLLLSIVVPTSRSSSTGSLHTVHGMCVCVPSPEVGIGHLVKKPLHLQDSTPQSSQRHKYLQVSRPGSHLEVSSLR